MKAAGVDAMDDGLLAVLEQRLGELLSKQRLGLLQPNEEVEITQIGAAFTRRLPGVPRTASPRCVLMSGMPGSGKTRLALALAEQGMTRLCPDEEMFRRYGRYGPDFPRGEFRVREAPVLADLGAELEKLLAAGKDVVFDHGFWTPEDRTAWRSRVARAGGVPLMVFLPVPHEVRWSRIRERNAHAHVDANSIEFSEEDLLRFAGRFIQPTADEEHFVYAGDPASVVSAMWFNGAPESSD